MAKAQGLEYDAIIVGGGAAGLNAALVLARSRRSVLVIDAGRPRNYAARHMHNFLSRDGINPARLLEIGRRELDKYGAKYVRSLVTEAECAPGGFCVRTQDGLAVTSKLLLLATGVVDELPGVANIQAFYGLGVHHCPYCDGWEYRDKPLAAYGKEHAGLGLALSLLTWSKDVTILTDGETLDNKGVREAARFGIKLREEKVAALTTRRGAPQPHKNEPLGCVTFESGPALRVAAMFFNTDQTQRSQLPQRLGCRMNEFGGIIRDRRQRTGVRGLYLAGDASVDVQFVVVAAAEGAKAGMAMNSELQEQERKAVRKAGRGSNARRTANQQG